MNKRYVLLLIGLMLFASCSVKKNALVNKVRNEEYKGKYASFLDQGEVEIESKYHYVVTKTAEGNSIYRQFFPETMTLTREQHKKGLSSKMDDGSFKAWWDDGKKQTVGHYENGKRVGEWRQFHRENGAIQSKGNWVNGEREGESEYYNLEGNLYKKLTFVQGVREGPFFYYDENGKIENEGIYKEGEVISQTNATSNTEKFGEVYKVVEEMPFFCSAERGYENCTRGTSDIDLFKFIGNTIRYPALARENDIEGRIIAQFTVAANGDIDNVVILNGICESMRDETIRVLELMPRWHPGIQRGKKVPVQYTMPIVFKLE